MSEFVALMEFDSDSHEFRRGFECGRMWANLRACQADDHSICAAGSYQFDVHADTAEMLLRLAEATGHTVQSEDLDETWLTASFEEAV